MSPRLIGLIIMGVMVTSLSLSVFGEKGLVRLYELRRERDELREETIRLEKQNRELERRIELLQNDKHYLERIAREELGLIGPNEMVFLFPKMDSHSKKKDEKRE